MKVQEKISMLNALKGEMLSEEEKVKAQKDIGKLTARARIEAILDSASFVESNTFIKSYRTDGNSNGEGVVTGTGTIDGKPVCIYAQDYTVLSGAMGAAQAKKIVAIMELAVKLDCPIIAVLDSEGARIEEGLSVLSGYAEILNLSANISGCVPQITLVHGPCVGTAAYLPELSDFVFMVDEIGLLTKAAPQVISAVTGTTITAQELGGAEVHAEQGGDVSITAGSEADSIAWLKQLMGYLPLSSGEFAELYENLDDPNRSEEMLNSIITDDDSLYDVVEVIKAIADNGEFLEIMPLYAPNMVCGFARFNGQSTGIVANQNNQQEGLLDGKACEKAAKFVRTCDSFNIPIVSLTDTPGYISDIDAEKQGEAKKVAKLIYAFSEASVAKINIVMGKAYGSALVVMNSKSLGADYSYAWATAEMSVTAPETAANIIYAGNIANSEDPVGERAKMIQAYKDTCADPFTAAAEGIIDDVIEPANTRQYLINALEMLVYKTDDELLKKHDTVM